MVFDCCSGGHHFLPDAHSHELTHPFIRDFTLSHYPRELLVPVEFAWFFILGGLVFFASRASLALLLIGAGLILFMRFFA
jgi:hypothetical protein